MKKSNFQTFGCKLNSYETEIMESLCKKEGFKDVKIINTCAVTAEAVKKAKKTIRRSYRENISKKIIVTGCAAQIKPETFSSMNEVDYVIGNEEKLSKTVWRNIKKANYTGPKSPKVIVNDIMNIKNISPVLINKLGDRSRAYVQIQSGCDHRCTFCVIPFGRGNSRSVSLETVLDQVEKLVNNGFNEIVLTGVDITSWGNDLPDQPRLGALVHQILSKTPHLQRLRLSSIDSVEVDNELMDIIVNEQRFMPHLHLSLQSGSNLILKRMKRRHSREQAINFCQAIRLKRPEVTFGADIIVGFPTESNEMFQHSVELVHECNLTWLHVFPFSAREGTPAARMPHTDQSTIKKRADTLRKLGQTKIVEYLDSVVGEKHAILIEGNGKGRTETFAEVLVDPKLKAGVIKNLVAVNRNGLKLQCF